MTQRSKSQYILITLTLGAFLLFFCGMEYGKFLMEEGLPEVGRYETGNTSNENEIREIPHELSTKEKLSKCVFRPLMEAQQFLNYGSTQKHCEKLVPFGGPANYSPGKYYDGQKMVCQDEIYKMNPENCVVLSFGISNDWTFDDAMGKFGCKVFSFDPTIGLKDHKRSQNIQFRNLGIGNAKTEKPFRSLTIEIDRYEGILQKLNLTNSIIDYLKIDVEGAEVEFFNDVFQKSPQLLDNVKQIGMELHPDRVSDNGPPTGRMLSYWTSMNLLKCLGFKLFSWEPNMAGPNPYKRRNRQESACYEVLWGRTLEM